MAAEEKNESKRHPLDLYCFLHVGDLFTERDANIKFYICSKGFNVPGMAFIHICLLFYFLPQILCCYFILYPCTTFNTRIKYMEIMKLNYKMLNIE